jgi:hypothetical protein
MMKKNMGKICRLLCGVPVVYQHKIWILVIVTFSLGQEKIRPIFNLTRLFSLLLPFFGRKKQDALPFPRLHGSLWLGRFCEPSEA